MTSPVLDVTLTGRLVQFGLDGETPLSASEFTRVLDKIADCLHGETDDACVSGQASTGEVEMWFLVPNAQTMPAALRQAADIVHTVGNTAGIQWRASDTDDLPTTKAIAIVGTLMRQHFQCPKTLTAV